MIRTPVGEAHVADAMIRNACMIGGEGNGGVIDLRVGPIRDSLVGMALVLQLMADTGKTVRGLEDEIGRFEMVKTKYPADKKQAQEIMEQTKILFSKARIDTRDGCRFDLPDGWIHVRSSNTEPIIRIIFEFRDPKITEEYRKQMEEICRRVLSP